jgi:hypothetical protein
MVGNGRVAARAVVDLDAIAKRRSSGRASGRFDVWSLVGGKVPVTVAGVLRTTGGTGTFEFESADVSGIPVPKTVLQELVSYYTRSTDNPRGVNLDEAFPLPASIQHVDVGAGQVVIVQ